MQTTTFSVSSIDFLGHRFDLVRYKFVHAEKMKFWWICKLILEDQIVLT